jgi:hypothetical protein
MTYQQALAAASKRARKLRAWVGVVREDLDDDDSYDTATDEELETFHCGARCLAYFDPDGKPA